ncbi:MAG: cytochrome c3 family protein [Pseudomonadota bacterium]
MRWPLCWVRLLLVLFGWPGVGMANPLERLVMPGPVHAVHAAFESNCAACHSPVDQQPQTTLCTSCHVEVGQDLKSGSGYHGLHPKVQVGECQACHAEHEGRDAEMSRFPLLPFDHMLTDFHLQGAHAVLDCSSCHQEGEAFRSAPTDCAGCHAEDDPHAGRLGPDCASCHGDTAWMPARFDHATTGFLLAGGHSGLSCDGCHRDASFSHAQPACASCHAADDVHGGAFGNQCASCHSPASWTQTGFDHAVTGFLLTGAHATARCSACHRADIPASAAPRTCQGCHQEDDVHDGQFGNQCADCHSTSTWTGSRFDHTAASGFELLGRHQQLPCDACHTGALSEPLPTTCASCHTEDPHDGQLGSACERCHNNVSWVMNVHYDHTFSEFPLLGRHRSLLCRDCHLTRRFLDVDSSCITCHAGEDVHQGAFGRSCSNCHTEAGWPVSDFEHELTTGFPLHGAHDELHCHACHRGELPLPTANAEQCQACHAKDDPHGGSFGGECAQCHSTAGFLPVRRY